MKKILILSITLLFLVVACEINWDFAFGGESKTETRIEETETTIEELIKKIEVLERKQDRMRMIVELNNGFGMFVGDEIFPIFWELTQREYYDEDGVQLICEDGSTTNCGGTRFLDVAHSYKDIGMSFDEFLEMEDEEKFAELFSQFAYGIEIIGSFRGDGGIGSGGGFQSQQDWKMFEDMKRDYERRMRGY